MGFLDRLLGRGARETYPPPAPPSGHAPSGRAATPGGYGAVPDGGGTSDERAVARYRYLLRTAPPESLEQVHAEAFARLSAEQRRQVLDDLARDLPPGEQPPSEDPQSMARFATRAELRRPGYLEQAFGRRPGTGMGGMGGGMGMGGTVMGSMMGTVAGVVVGSMLADALLDGYDSSPEASAASDTGDASDPGASTDPSASTDSGASMDSSDVTDSGDVTAADAGYDAGGLDSGGYGGGDFGGGSDFGGGGDFGGGF